jgi:hypothetical protein
MIPIHQKVLQSLSSFCVCAFALTSRERKMVNYIIGGSFVFAIKQRVLSFSLGSPKRRNSWMNSSSNILSFIMWEKLFFKSTWAHYPPSQFSLSYLMPSSLSLRVQFHIMWAVGISGVSRSRQIKPVSWI